MTQIAMTQMMNQERLKKYLKKKMKQSMSLKNKKKVYNRSRNLRYLRTY